MKIKVLNNAGYINKKDEKTLKRMLLSGISAMNGYELNKLYNSTNYYTFIHTWFEMNKATGRMEKLIQTYEINVNL